MKAAMRIATLRTLWVLFIALCSVGHVNGQALSGSQNSSTRSPQSTADALNAIDKLVEQNKQLEKQNAELMGEIESLRRSLSTNPGALSISAAVPPQHAAPQRATPQEKEEENEAITEPAMEGAQEGQPTEEALAAEAEAGPRKFGSYTPNFGFTVVDTNSGSMNVSIFSYLRYLNQLDLAPTYTNAFGMTSLVKQRQDFQLAKVQFKFLGWILNPDLRYFMYVWTSNANMGQGAQVVVAGNLNYTFGKHFTLAGGVNALPGTRSLEGNFPYWLSEDSRLIADEFFRPSYTSGLWARGLVTDKIRYSAMIGDNLSQLGVNAGQLTNHPTTFSGSLVWMPRTGEFGPGFGDFENHETLATRLGIHFTRSRENKQSQPGTEDFQNTQLRLSDGSIIFTPFLFGPGIVINNVTYKMTSFDGGIKYRGFSLDGEYYLRWLNNFTGLNTTGLHGLFDHGFQTQISEMLIPKTFQIYAGGSTIFGQYGTPYDARIGVNWFPDKNRVFRWNTEGLYLYNSPVGYLAAPYPVGGKGWVIHSNLEMAF